MSHIEINSNDLTLLARDIDEISGKINNLKDSLNSKFKKVKESNVFDNGFNNINKYLDQELSSLTDVKSKIKKYQSDVKGIEESFGQKFNNIIVPSVGNSSNIAVANPITFAQKSDNNESSGGSNVLGIIAGAAGAVGAAGLAGVAYMKSREEKPKEEEEEEDSADNQSTENYVNNIVKEYY